MNSAVATREVVKTTRAKPLRYTFDDVSDYELVQACQLKNEQAFNSLIRRHERSMRSVLFKLAPDMHGEHDDMMQRIQIRIWKSIASLQNPGAFKAWLNRLITNQFYDDLRKHRNFTLSLDEPMSYEDGDDHPSRDIPDPGLQPDQWVQRNETVQEIGAVFKALPVNFRNVLILRELHGLHYEEIAVLTNTELGTVKSRIARARVKVQKRLGHLQCA